MPNHTSFSSRHRFRHRGYLAATPLFPAKPIRGGIRQHSLVRGILADPTTVNKMNRHDLASERLH